MTASIALVVPTLGAPELERALDAVDRLDPAPTRVVVVASGPEQGTVAESRTEVIRSTSRLGFAAAVNRGLEQVLAEAELVAVLNDDAIVAPHWLGAVAGVVASDPGLAAVQGTVVDAAGNLVDGRGISLDRWGLPVQADRGDAAEPEPGGTRPVLAVSWTAAVFRSEALRQAAGAGGTVLDPSFGSYHEDLDLGLRLRRLGWGASWTCGAPCHHTGSATGRRMRWRHPWWVLANRWRAVAGNLTAGALLRELPRLLRGEVRAVHTLLRCNPRALPVSAAVLGALPVLIGASLRRATPGPRLSELPEVQR